MIKREDETPNFHPHTPAPSWCRRNMDPMAARYIPTKRGKEKLMDGDGFVYAFSKNGAGGKKIWAREARHGPAKCAARAHTTEGAITNVIGSHSHVVNPEKAEVSIVRAKARDLATHGMGVTGQVAIDAKAGASQTALGAICDDNLRQIIRRRRVKVQAAPPNPSDRASIVVPAEVQSYSGFDAGGEPFLLRDSGPGDAARFLVFGTQRNVDYLSNASDWYSTDLSASRRPFSPKCTRYVRLGLANACPCCMCCY